MFYKQPYCGAKKTGILGYFKDFSLKTKKKRAEEVCMYKGRKISYLQIDAGDFLFCKN